MPMKLAPKNNRALAALCCREDGVGVGAAAQEKHIAEIGARNWGRRGAVPVANRAAS